MQFITTVPCLVP